MESANGDHSSGNTTVKAEVCKIIHIPDKPPVLPHLQPTGKFNHRTEKDSCFS